MKIGLVGAGRIGGTLATLRTRAGHEVALANSRGPGTLADQAAQLGPRAHAVDTGTLADSWRQEPGAPVYGAEVPANQATVLIARATR